ncbi:hypothetical protein QQF64_023942 [Cirrhinus molitorella]|uniref:Uncharacterized protein n=1 Tax=Cirrhinus molitorella TaxID=172907 RepID=A0ABR3NK22_9TELE
MSGIIPKSEANGTDICAFNNYYYIIRSDLCCYMRTSGLNESSDISIFSLHPACQNGDHYIGGDSYFHIIKGDSCRRVTNLTTDGESVVYNLHTKCQGGDHYFAAFGYFYIIFRKKGTYRRTTNMNYDLHAEEHTLHSNNSEGLYYWGPPYYKRNGKPNGSQLLSCCYFLKPVSKWGVEFCTGPDLSKDKYTAVYSVHPSVLNFLPGGLWQLNYCPAIGIWQNIKTITNDSTTPVTWQKKVTKIVGYNKEKISQITHNWKIDASFRTESENLAKLIAKLQFSLSAGYGYSSVSIEKESWNEATEEEELLTFELKPNESLYLWQYKLCHGHEPVLYCCDLKINNDPNPPTVVPLHPAQP